MSDITLTLTVPQAFQVQEALDYKLAALYAREERIGRYGGSVDSVARRNLEAAKAALIERLYPDLPEQEDPITAAKAAADEDEWTNREGMPEFNGAFR
jgi:hypothetical protein